MSSPKIMIVDSYGSDVRSLSHHLKELSPPIEILSATDADSVMDRLHSEPIDLMIIDAFLPGKSDGFDLCCALKSIPEPKPPVILMLSGYLLLERDKGMRSGANLLLHRPVVKEELLQMVRLLLGHKLPESQGSEVAPLPEFGNNEGLVGAGAKKHRETVPRC